MRRVMPVVCGVLLVAVPYPASAQPQARTVVEGLDSPTGIAFLADGTMVVGQRAGAIGAVAPRGSEVEGIAEIPTVVEGETGLVGIAVTPDATSVYAFATESDGESNSIWRVGIEGGEPERIVTGMPAGLYHNGGGLAFDRDGMLLAANGESHNTDLAQDPSAFGGKVYRFTPEGEIPRDNPFDGSPALAVGLRNPFGLTVDPLTGTPWVTENGPSSFDEVNRIISGGNYGWPEISGPAPEGTATGDLIGDYQDPAIAYEDIIVPTGLAFSGANAMEEYAGDLFFAAYGEGALHHLELDHARERVVSDEILHQGEEPIIAVAWGPEGLYFSTLDSIEVIPIAAEEEEETPGDATGTVAPSPTPRDPPALTGDDDDDGRSVLGVLLIVVVVAALLIAFLATRRRLNESTRDDGSQPPGV